MKNSVWAGGLWILPALTGAGALLSAIRWVQANSMFSAFMGATLLIATFVIVIWVNKEK